MKKVLALGAMAVVLGLSSLGLEAPVMAVSMGDSSTISATDATIAICTAIVRAEEALAATADSTVVAGVASMRAYLQKWVAQARTVDASRLTTAQLEELVAALNEGARGLRATAGVDRKVATGAAESGAVSSASSSATVSATVPEPRVMKELSDMSASTGVAPVASTNSAATVSGPVVSGSTSTAVTSSTGAKGEVATLANAGVAQVKKPVVAAATDKVASAKEVAELGDSEVEVPKTGMDEEEEKASSAVRGIGLILGGAVVLAAAAGAVLIVKRMKRGV